MNRDFKSNSYSIDYSFISGEKSIKVYASNGPAPYPYVIKIGETIAALSVEGIKELIEALVRVL
jgi:hypothetical protein